MSDEKKPAAPQPAPKQEPKPAKKGIGQPGDGFKHSQRRPSQQEADKAKAEKK